MPIELLDVDRAIDRSEFVPHFQPLMNLRTGELQGFELLARWNHPELGWIPPDTFVPLAEKNGWIGRLTSELLQMGFRAAAELPHSLMLATNISPVQLHDLNLPNQIQSLAEQSGFSLERLTIEITESALTDDMDRARTIVGALKEMGCRLALDDFGTGYSSLSHLQCLPFDVLKVDRRFVSSMAEQRDSRKIVAAVVGLGQSLGLTTVAEGIETQEQAEMLRWLGCELGQGWLFGRPVPAEELDAVVSDVTQTRPPSLSSDVVGRVSCSSLDSLPAQRLAHLQALYDGAPVGLAFLDRDLRYINVNRRLANMNGRSMEEHLGRTVAEIIPEVFSLIEPYLRRALSGESVNGVEVNMRPAAATSEAWWILLSYEPARDEAGEVIGISVSLVDVTPRKRAEEARRESEDHFRYMIELLPQIPWVIDPEGGALDVSRRWLEITGTTDEQWRGFAWLDSLHPDDVQPTIDAMHAAFASGKPIDIVYRVRSSESAPWKPMRSRGSARIDADGRIVCWYGYLEPVDEDT